MKIDRNWTARAEEVYDTNVNKVGYRAVIIKPRDEAGFLMIMGSHWQGLKLFPPTWEGKKEAEICAGEELAKLKTQ